MVSEVLIKVNDPVVKITGLFLSELLVIKMLKISFDTTFLKKRRLI